MNQKKILLALGAFGLVTQTGCATTHTNANYAAQNTTNYSNRTPAKDSSLPAMPANFETSAVPLSGPDRSKATTFYNLMESTIKAGIDKTYVTGDYATNMEAGKGYSVKLDDNNYNFHVGFPNTVTGGRSYGWTLEQPGKPTGDVGDWSDEAYLEHIIDAVKKSPEDIPGFYGTIIQMLGSCDASGLAGYKLQQPTQRVATTFLAIYTAEEYRAMVPKPTKGWDDALLEVSFLAAFHSGQSTFTKFYKRTFSALSFTQTPSTGVYQNATQPQAGGTGVKPADMTDYWQFSAANTQSGIHETAKDYQLMGSAITQYEESKKNANLAKIEAIVGKGANVITSISQYFTNNQARVEQTTALATAVSAFMGQVKADANDITTWIPNNFKAPVLAPTASPKLTEETSSPEDK